MARTRALELKVSVDQVEGLAGRLGRLSATSLGLGAIEAVNEVTTRFNDTQQAGQIADINLSPSYVRSKTDVTLAANPAAPRAQIVTRGDLTILGRFDPVIQIRQQSVRSKAAGPRRGRPAGVRVQIKRSVQANEPKWFTMRLRNGLAEGDNIGVFVRTSRKKTPKHIYGPSPYSLFRFQIDSRRGELERDLSTTAVRRIGGAIEDALL